MNEPANSYWSIETCAWVRYLSSAQRAAEAEVPVQRPAGEADEVVEPDGVEPSGTPV